jgi:hypothetical protein
MAGYTWRRAPKGTKIVRVAGMFGQLVIFKGRRMIPALSVPLRLSSADHSRRHVQHRGTSNNGMVSLQYACLGISLLSLSVSGQWPMNDKSSSSESCQETSCVPKVPVCSAFSLRRKSPIQLSNEKRLLVNPVVGFN